MASELDRTYDAVMAAVTGPQGRIQVGPDEQGRAIVTNLPPTLALLFDVFCTIYGASEALVCHDERLTFAELHTHTVRAAKALAARGIGKGDRDRDAQRARLDRQLFRGAEGGRRGRADQRLVGT